jgi:biotin carboxyl carrier protein
MEKLTMAIEFSIGGETQKIEIVRRRPHLVLTIGHRRYEVMEEGGAGPRHQIRVEGKTINFVAARDANTCFVRLAAKTWRISLFGPAGDAGGATEGVGEIRAPMPGVVVSVHKKQGDVVQRGETIVTIESMKLQMALAAPRDGIVDRLVKQPNEAFDKDEIIASVLPIDATG